MVDLRPYQSRSVEALRDARRAGHRRILFTCATGSGKSVVAAYVIAGWVARGGTVLCLAHRREILFQLVAHLERAGCLVGMILAGEPEHRDRPVQVASIQSLVRRDLPTATMVVVDEAHRTSADSYAQVLASYRGAWILGLTATPCRLDGKPLKDHYDVLVQGPMYSELMECGAIARPIVYAPRNKLDLTGVGTQHGDYQQDKLESAMRRPHVIGNVVREWMSATGWPGRRVQTVCFAVGIEHSKELVGLFSAESVVAEHLDGETPGDERLAILLRLESGETTVVCNVGVLCEGWDQPKVKCAVMACPTLSTSKFMQCVGRILRPWHDAVTGDVVDPIVLDHGDNVRLHGLPHEDREWSLESGLSRLTKPATHRMCPWCYAYVKKNPCEVCGHKTEGKPREVRKADGVLARIDAGIARDRMQDPRRAFFDRELSKAREQGFRLGYASAKFKEKFGSWPPYAWKQEAESTMTPEWRALIMQRERQRLFWQGRKAQQAAPMMAAPDDEES